MNNLNKKQVISELEKLVVLYSSGNRKNATYVERLRTLLRVIKKQAKENSVYYTTYNKSGHINIGYLVESIALKYLGLESEDEEHEVKSFVLNSWNTLVNEDVKWVYVVVVGNSKKIENGFYKVKANEIRGKRGNLEVLRSCGSIEKISSLSRMVGA